MSETYYIRMTLTEAEYAALHQRADVRQWPLTVTARAAMVLGLEIQRRVDIFSIYQGVNDEGQVSACRLSSRRPCL